MMTMNNKNEKIIDLLAEIIYELYEQLKKGNITNESFSRKKQAVGKSAKKAKTFHQTEFKYEE